MRAGATDEQHVVTERQAAPVQPLFQHLRRLVRVRFQLLKVSGAKWLGVARAHRAVHHVGSIQVLIDKPRSLRIEEVNLGLVLRWQQGCFGR